MSEEIRARFHTAASIANDTLNPALKVLAELNNVDKHRSSLVLAPRSDGGQLGANIDFGEPRDQPTSMQIHPLLAVGSPMDVGTSVLALEWDYAFKSVDTSAEIETAPWVNVAFEGEPENYAPVVPMLWGLHNHVSVVLEFICEGQLGGHREENNSA